jgi:hypothetical protein
MPTTKRTTTLPARIPHRLPHSHLSTLPPSPASNSYKNADGNVPPASRCVPAAARSARQRQQRPSTSHAPHPSTRSSTTETTTNHPQIPKTRSLSPSSPPTSRRPPPPPPLPPHPQSQSQPRQPIPVRVEEEEDSCLCGRRNAGVRRRTRTSRASSGSSAAANRDVLPRWPEVVRKARNASVYDLEQPVWRRRRRPRCPRWHAQNQVRRTGTQDRHSFIDPYMFRLKCFCVHISLCLSSR